MPVPEGELTTAEIWSDPNAVNNETVEETEDVKVQEEAGKKIFLGYYNVHAND